MEAAEAGREGGIKSKLHLRYAGCRPWCRGPVDGASCKEKRRVCDMAARGAAGVASAADLQFVVVFKHFVDVILRQE